MKNLENLSFPKARGSAGYTLVEMAVCLSIIGILASSGILGVSAYFGMHKTAGTRQKMDFVMNALSAYAQTHYRLPCPADPKAPAAQAGQEEDSGKCFVTGGNHGDELMRALEEAWQRYVERSSSKRLTI